MIAMDFADLYARYFRDIRGYIYRQTGDAETVDDLTAEVFVKVIDAAQRGIAMQFGVTNWIYRIAHNLVIDEYRANNRRKVVSLDDLEEAGNPLSAETNFDHLLLCHCLNGAAQHLTDTQREVVELRVAGYSHAEIALLTERDEGAVRSMWQRALATMQKHLGDVVENPPTAREGESSLSIAINALKSRGPMTLKELSMATRLTRPTLHMAIWKNSDLFIKVGARGRSVIWDVAP